MSDLVYDERPTVEPWVILMAFRYGVGRSSYAFGDALRLVPRHWPHLAKWRTSIVADLEGVVAERHMEFSGRAQELLDWIAEQPEVER